MAKKKASNKKKTYKYLSPEEVEFMEQRQSLKEIKKEEKELFKEKKGARAETTIGQVKGFIFPKKPKDISAKIKSKRATKLLKLQVAPRLTREQGMLQEMFGGSPSWGTGRNLPKFHRTLMSGYGLVNSGDDEKETASMFGF